jgi:hypothetical protein
VSNHHLLLQFGRDMHITHQGFSNSCRLRLRLHMLTSVQKTQLLLAMGWW